MNRTNTLGLPRGKEYLWVVGGLVGVAGLSWAYTIHLARPMADMPMQISMPMWQPWSAVEFLFMVVMWAVMMAAMMVPSAAPVILLFASAHRQRSERGGQYGSTAVFLLGYLVVWSGFSVLATGLQWALHKGALLSPMMVATSPWLGAAVFIAAGLFQWTPLKEACLAKCRSPLGFLLSEWRDGAGGALVMGLRHGAYCTGCCWVLMSLLFVGGVMNLLWVAAIAAFVLAEKVLPYGGFLGRVAGAALIGWGVWLATTLFF